MKLDAITARVRLRSGLRATDFGVALARRWWTAYMPAWLMITAPFFLAGAALVFWASANPALVIFGLWWLKPLYDRVVLFYLSRAFFGEKLELGKILQLTIRSWIRWPAILEITFLRLLPVRGTLDPVLELERPSPSRAWSRFWNLLGGFDGNGLFLGVILEWVMVFSGFILVSLIMPQTVEYDSGMIFESIFEGLYAPGTATLGIFIYWFAITAVEPFFVATGFSSYINRRIELEGWDIELVFRNLAQRLKRRASDALERAASFLLFGLAALFAASVFAAPEPAFAQEDGYDEPAHEEYEKLQEYEEYEDDGEGVRFEEPAPEIPEDAEILQGHYDLYDNWIPGAGYYDDNGNWIDVDGYFDEEGNFVVDTLETDLVPEVTDDGYYARSVEDPASKIDAILANPEFGEKVTEETWQLKEREETSEPEADSPTLDTGLLQAIATVLKVLAYAILAFILGAIIYLIVRRLRDAEFSRDAELEREATSIVLPDGRTVALPTSWLEDVMPIWNEGERILALSLLYRGALDDLKAAYGIKIPKSATAREIVRIVRKGGGPHEFIRGVGIMWTREVYAARGPDTADVQEAVTAYRELSRLREVE